MGKQKIIVRVPKPSAFDEVLAKVKITKLWFFVPNGKHHFDPEAVECVDGKIHVIFDADNRTAAAVWGHFKDDIGLSHLGIGVTYDSPTKMGKAA